MPSRTHRPIADPPRWYDHILAHPLEFSLVGFGWTAIGGLLCYSWVHPGGGPVTILASLPSYLAGAISLALLAGGLATVAAILWPGKDSTAWMLEIVGLPLGIAAWLSYGLASPSTWWAIIAGAYSGGCALRLIALVHLRRNPPIWTQAVRADGR